ncbi:MAG: restriction endonuclease subunit S, partial [Proteobacteria bacterium]|nr:restriction endonuclease subunit S [Pseudomonadota bacterium]
MIEQLKTGWKIKKLGEVCEFVRGPFGGSLKKNIFRSDGYAVYEQKHAIYDRFDNVRYFIDENKFNEMKRFELNSGDLIMSCSGTIGKIAIVPENIKKGIINQALLKLSPSKKVSTVFLKLWMQSESFKDSLNEYSQGAAIKNVASVAILKNIQVPLPALPEQKRIVAILNKAFTTIAKAKANAEENLKNAKALFESYLQGVFKGEDWEEKRLVEITSLLGDGLHGTPQYTEDGEYYFINGNNLNNGIIQYKKTTQRVSIEEYHKYKKNLTDRTVLVSINGTLGNVAFYNNEKI